MDLEFSKRFQLLFIRFKGRGKLSSKGKTGSKGGRGFKVQKTRAENLRVVLQVVLSARECPLKRSGSSESHPDKNSVTVPTSAAVTFDLSQIPEVEVTDLEKDIGETCSGTVETCVQDIENRLEAKLRQSFRRRRRNFVVPAHHAEAQVRV